MKLDKIKEKIIKMLGGYPSSEVCKLPHKDEVEYKVGDRIFFYYQEPCRGSRTWYGYYQGFISSIKTETGKDTKYVISTKNEKVVFTSDFEVTEKEIARTKLKLRFKLLSHDWFLPIQEDVFKTELKR